MTLDFTTVWEQWIRDVPRRAGMRQFYIGTFDGSYVTFTDGEGNVQSIPQTQILGRAVLNSKLPLTLLCIYQDDIYALTPLVKV